MFVKDYQYWITYDPDTMIIWGSGKSAREAFRQAIRYTGTWNDSCKDNTDPDAVLNLLTIPASPAFEKEFNKLSGEDIKDDWEVVDGKAQLK